MKAIAHLANAIERAIKVVTQKYSSRTETIELLSGVGDHLGLVIPKHWPANGPVMFAEWKVIHQQRPARLVQASKHWCSCTYFPRNAMVAVDSLCHPVHLVHTDRHGCWRWRRDAAIDRYCSPLISRTVYIDGFTLEINEHQVVRRERECAASGTP